MWEIMYGMCLAFPVVAYFFVPVYFSLGITSVYQVSLLTLFFSLHIHITDVSHLEGTTRIQDKKEIYFYHVYSMLYG